MLSWSRGQVEDFLVFRLRGHADTSQGEALVSLCEIRRQLLQKMHGPSPLGPQLGRVQEAHSLLERQLVVFQDI